MSQPPPPGYQAPPPGPQQQLSPQQWSPQQWSPQSVSPQQMSPQQMSPQPSTIEMVTTESFPGRAISVSLGEVMGVAVRERELDRSQDRATAYPAMLLRSRQQAVARMADMARDRGADAVVGLRFDSSEITQDLSEVVAYGTAVRFAG